jgi:signal transduction histidine kinase/DNA-binding response OmpR family regulator
MGVIERKQKEGTRFSKRFITTGIAAILALLAITALLIINISSRETLDLEIAVLVGESKLKGDMIHFESMLKTEYGELRLQNGELVDKNGYSLAYQNHLVDRMAKDLGIVASIFVKENDDYRRIATSVPDSEGNRAVDTFLGSGSAAYAPIQAGKEYIGKAVILGKDYLTMHSPIFQPDTNEVIGALAVSVEMAAIHNIIAQKSNMRTIQTFIIRIVLIALGTLLAVVLITIFLRTSREKAKADERMRIMFDAMPLGANIHNKNFDFFDCNEAAVSMFGLSSKQEFREKFFSLWPEYQPDGQLSSEKMAQFDKKVFTDGYCRFEWTYQNPKGELIPGECTLVRVKHDNEFILAAYMRDLRELKTSFEQIYESEQSLNILSNMLNGLDAMIFVTVPDTGEILFVNDQMKREFNIKDEGIGLLCYEVFEKGMNGICDFCPCSRLHEEPDRIITWEKRNEKTKRIYRHADRYIEWQNGKIVHIQYSIDITEIIEAKELAERSNRSKNQFLSRMSHEVRTPMNAILGITEIQMESETLSPDTKEALCEIYNSGYLLLGIINDILDLSKIEAGKLELTPSVYDVPSLINDTVHLNVIRYDSKPIEFILYVDENIPSKLYGDELRIKQILNNLLSNAFKYTDEGEISLSIAVKYDTQGARDITLLFSVSDTGQGMTAEQLDILFDEYTRFNMEANSTTEGTGLGMSITKQLVIMMNGDISVESEPGKGTTFTVCLPQGNVDAEVLGREVAENLMQFRVDKVEQMRKGPRILREYMPYGRILIVDDVETNLYVARGLMTPYGLSVETATSGFEAIEKIKGGLTFDIIFMDHFMPKMDGIETVRIIRGLGYMHPIIALTANALAGQAEMFMENGFDGFISKPIDIRQLNASLNKLVRDKYPLEVVETARQQAAKINTMRTAALKEQSASGSELAALFVRDAEKALENLKIIISHTFRRADDFRQYVINVHSMKSALANIGEDGLSTMALKLELAGRAENIPAIESETPGFLEALSEVIKKNKPMEDGERGEVADWDEAYLRQKLADLQAACAVYDIRNAKAISVELNQKKWPHEVRGLLNKISEYLLHSDFEEAVKIAKDFLQH